MIEPEQPSSEAPRRPAKSEAAFRTISEVSDDLDVPQHVLRFWESKFPQIKPLKRGGGRRYYRPEDVQLLRRIRDLLYKDGYTIRGVQKLLRDTARGGSTAADTARPPPPMPEPEEAAPEPPVELDSGAPTLATEPAVGGLTAADRALLQSLLDELEDLRGLLVGARQSGDAE